MRINNMARSLRQLPFDEPKPSARQRGIRSADRGPKLTLVSRFNDDGHFCGLEAMWIPLGAVVGPAFSRVTGCEQ
jgi:hypothetical protein